MELPKFPALPPGATGDRRVSPVFVVECDASVTRNALGEVCSQHALVVLGRGRALFIQPPAATRKACHIELLMAGIASEKDAAV